MNWKKLIEKGTEPKVGNKYRLNPDTDKSDWSIGDLSKKYGKVFTMTKKVDKKGNNIMLEDYWQMGREFLNEHFILVDVP